MSLTGEDVGCTEAACDGRGHLLQAVNQVGQGRSRRGLRCSLTCKRQRWNAGQSCSERRGDSATCRSGVAE